MIQLRSVLLHHLLCELQRILPFGLGHRFFIGIQLRLFFGMFVLPEVDYIVVSRCVLVDLRIGKRGLSASPPRGTECIQHDRQIDDPHACTHCKRRCELLMSTELNLLQQIASEVLAVVADQVIRRSTVPHVVDRHLACNAQLSG